MKKTLIVYILCLFCSHLAAGKVLPEIINQAPFGKLRVFKPEQKPNSFAIIISGDGGWDKYVANIVANTVKQGGLVVCVDYKEYMKGLKSYYKSDKKYYPAADFESISISLQKRYKLPEYHKPILIGYSSGATLAYAAIAQSPSNTFKGGIGFGFSADLEVDRPLSTGSGLKMHQGKHKGTYDIEPDKNLNAPFYALHGCKDKACPLGDTKAFFKDNTNAKVIEIPNLTHSFLETNKWYFQFANAYHQINSLNYGQPKISTQNIIPLPNMPLTYVQAAKSDTFPFVFLITGDGGWTSFEESFCAALAAKGMPVIALDAQKYFWAAKTPDGTTVDISKAILHYQSQLHRKRFVLVGYSFGACVMPFIAYRLPVALKQQLAGVFSLSPDETADFEIHIADMLSIGTTEQYKVLDETKKIQYMHPVFIFGQQEDEKERLKFANTGSKVLTLPGTHHYNNNTSALASLIFQEMRK